MERIEALQKAQPGKELSHSRSVSPKKPMTLPAAMLLHLPGESALAARLLSTVSHLRPSATQVRQVGIMQVVPHM